MITNCVPKKPSNIRVAIHPVCKPCKREESNAVVNTVDGTDDDDDDNNDSDTEFKELFKKMKGEDQIFSWITSSIQNNVGVYFFLFGSAVAVNLVLCCILLYCVRLQKKHRKRFSPTVEQKKKRMKTCFCFKKKGKNNEKYHSKQIFPQTKKDEELPGFLTNENYVEENASANLDNIEPVPKNKTVVDIEKKEHSNETVVDVEKKEHSIDFSIPQRSSSLRHLSTFAPINEGIPTSFKSEIANYRFQRRGSLSCPKKNDGVINPPLSQTTEFHHDDRFLGITTDRRVLTKPPIPPKLLVKRKSITNTQRGQLRFEPGSYDPQV